MKDISEKAKLQRLYTNHCVRVTVVSNLRDAGFEAQDIAAVTGHKSTASVERYVRRKRDDEKRSVSQILNESLRSLAEKTLHQQSPAKRFKTNETVNHDEPTVQSSSLNRESMNEILESQPQLSANLTISSGSLLHYLVVVMISHSIR